MDDAPPDPRFTRRVVALAPGSPLAYVAADWDDALVVVAEGAIELESRSGARLPLSRGAVLWLAGLPLRALHGTGSAPAVLVLVSRASQPSPSGADSRAAPA